MAVSKDPDDPAIWVNQRSPSASLVVGTNKVGALEGGGLYVYGLDGKIRQVITGLDHPNNVDVEYGVRIGGRTYDIAVVTERKQSRLRIFAFRPGSGTPLYDLAPKGLPVFSGEANEATEPMGIALYKRPRDGATFAIISRKTGPERNYLWQYRIVADRDGTPALQKVRRFGNFSGKEEVEAIAVDDALGYVYYADEEYGIRKWAADPDSPAANRELAVFANRGFRGDHEGIAIYTRPDGTGYIFCTEQREADEGGSRYWVFKREGERGNRHDHRAVAVIEGGADETDGIEITSRPLGAKWPRGLFVAMNDRGKNFLLYRAESVLPGNSR